MRWFTVASLCLAACGPELHSNSHPLTAADELACIDSAIIDLLNAEETTAEVLTALGLRSSAAYHLLHSRMGSDGVFGTDDDQLYTSLESVDDIPYVGPVSLELLEEWAELQCSDVALCTEPVVVMLINDPATTVETLGDIGVSRIGAANIVAAREAEALESLRAIAAVPGIDADAIAALKEWGAAHCASFALRSPRRESGSRCAQAA